jgi:hypothetical protein
VPLDLTPLPGPAGVAATFVQGGADAVVAALGGLGGGVGDAAVAVGGVDPMLALALTDAVAARLTERVGATDRGAGAGVPTGSTTGPALAGGRLGV